MSIAVGIQCREGIVLCADELFTTPGGGKSYGCKLWIQPEMEEPELGWKVFFAYSGFKQFMDAFKGHFREALNSVIDAEVARGKSSTVTDKTISDAVYSTLSWLEAEQRHETLTGAELLYVTAIGGQLRLHRTHGTLISDVQEYSAILGDSPLTKYLVPLLAGTIGGWNISHAIFSAAYLVRCACGYVDGCGGEMDLWIIRPSGLWQGLSAHSLPKIDEHFYQLEGLISRVISGLFSLVEPPEFERSIFRLSEKLLEDYRYFARFMAGQVRDDTITKS
jgi:hypothetical protein